MEQFNFMHMSMLFALITNPKDNSPYIVEPVYVDNAIKGLKVEHKGFENKSFMFDDYGFDIMNESHIMNHRMLDIILEFYGAESVHGKKPINIKLK